MVLFFALGGGDNGNPQPESRSDIFLRRLGKRYMLFKPDGHVPRLVNQFFIQSSEISHSGNCHANQFFQEIIHPRPLNVAE